MYNEEVKTRFLEDAATTHPELVDQYRRLFVRTTSYEEAQGKDLCQMENTELATLLEETGGVSKKTLDARISEIRYYTRWCLKNNIDGARSGLLSGAIDVDGDKSIKKYMVKNPGHLGRVLTKWREFNGFDPEHPGSGMVYEAFWWLAYSGMDVQDAMLVQGSNVDFSQMVIRVGGNTYPIYPPAVDLLKQCVERNTIYFDPNGRGKASLYPRALGDQLLRTRSELKVNSLRVNVSKCKHPYVEDDPDSIVLRYNSIQESGIFYEMFTQEEMFGMPVDFSHTASKLMRRKAERDGKQYSNSRSAYQSAYKLSVDYARWKKAFYG